MEDQRALYELKKMKKYITEVGKLDSIMDSVKERDGLEWFPAQRQLIRKYMRKNYVEKIENCKENYDKFKTDK